MKLFLTVGSMLPFDRLIHAMDEWAQGRPDISIVAQIGASQIRPNNMVWHSMLEPTEFRQQCANADLIVSHAGMGTLLTAAELRKPVVVLPRLASLGEVTSDHQVATVKWLAQSRGVYAAKTERELPAAIEMASRSADSIVVEARSRQTLVNALRSFIDGP